MVKNQNRAATRSRYDSSSSTLDLTLAAAYESARGLIIVVVRATKSFFLFSGMRGI